METTTRQGYDGGAAECVDYRDGVISRSGAAEVEAWDRVCESAADEAFSIRHLGAVSGWEPYTDLYRVGEVYYLRACD